MSVWKEAEALREAIATLQRQQYRAREVEFEARNTEKAIAWTAKALAAGTQIPPTGDRNMKAEDTAFVAIQFWCDDPDGTDEDLRSIIASAIRSAENEALERAAKELAMYADEASGHTEEEWAFEKAVEVVRALKHKEP